MRNEGGKFWKSAGELFPEVPEIPELEIYPRLVEQVWPLNEKHRAALPRDIRDLSRLLTTERGMLSEHYWQKAAFTSAYLYYFLPWNLVRLTRLLKGLPLVPPTEDAALLLDAGSGPLTLPLALWLAMPEWRKLPIRVVALDAAKKPLGLGVQLFRVFADYANLPPWDIQAVTGPLESLAAHTGGRRPWLVTAANVLNELKTPVPKHGSEAANRLESLLTAWEPLWEMGDPRLLFVEPGTRLGGKTIMALREVALEYGLAPLSPCTHGGECPLQSPRHSGTWCHFIFSARNAPIWLQDLSRAAGLFKTSLSLSPLLLGKTAPSGPELSVRVISRIFPANGSRCRYGCSRKGLGLMENAGSIVSGSLCMARPGVKGRDEKSGAGILAPEGMKEDVKGGTEVGARRQERRFGDRRRAGNKK